MKSLYTDIVIYVKKQIDNGILQEGDKLPSERELSISFEVSRNVVREAIGVLRVKGLINVQVGKGAYVTKPNPTLITETLERIMKNYNTTIENIIEVREELEKSIISKAVLYATTNDIEKLYEIYEEMEKNKLNVNKYIKLDMEFHVLLAQCTKNPLFYILLTSFLEMTQHVLFEFTRFIPTSIVQAQEHHLELIKAIDKKDEELAVRLVVSHIQVLRDETIILKGKRIL